MGGRARSAVANSNIDRSWQKWARCSVCRRRFCVNNFPDHQVRRKQYKFLDYWLCPTCEGREGKFFIKLMVLSEQLAIGTEKSCPNMPTSCKCKAHVIIRLLAKHEEAKP